MGKRDALYDNKINRPSEQYRTVIQGVNKKTFIIAFILCVLIVCGTVPITGRSQLNLIPASSLMSMSAQQYGTFLKENKISKDPQQTAMVKRVGTRIQEAEERYFTSVGCRDYLKDYKMLPLISGNEWQPRKVLRQCRNFSALILPMLRVLQT